MKDEWKRLIGQCIVSPMKCSTGQGHMYLLCRDTNEKVTLDGVLEIKSIEEYDGYPGYIINDLYFMGIGMTSRIMSGIIW